ncbi:hypothetical protein LCGC14_1871260, partial [marine sediment metagenome]
MVTSPQDLFVQNLNDPANPQIPPEQKEINDLSENEFLAKVKKKNSKILIKLTPLERERIARFIKDEYDGVKEKQNDISDAID